MIIIVGRQAVGQEAEVQATGIGGRLLHICGQLVGTCIIGKSLIANIGNDR